jgi:hypothetical protein
MDSSPFPPDYRCYVGVDIAATSFTASWTTDARTLPRAVTFAQTPYGAKKPSEAFASYAARR